MVTKNKFSPLKGYVRMSWAPENLYNLYRLSFKPPEHIASSLSFKRTSLTMFQQKWSSKRLLRAYHGDWLQERKFKRRFLPNALPPLESKPDRKGKTVDTGRSTAFEEREAAKAIPLASMMWREVEARLDTLVFRSCFAHSVYDARRLVTQGHVKLNGQVTRDPNILLEPGDLLQVDPKEMYLLREHDAPFSTQQVKSQEEEVEAEEADQADVEASAESAEQEASPESADARDVASTSEADSSAALTAGDAPAANPAKASSTSPSTKKLRASKVIPGLPFSLPDYAAPFLFIPAYLEVSFATCSTIYVRHPTARPGYSEIPSPYEADGEIARLTWEYYKGVGRRRRGVADWGDESSAEKAKEGEYDDKGRRQWMHGWEDLEMEKRRNRAVRLGRGRWANRPL